MASKGMELLLASVKKLVRFHAGVMWMQRRGGGIAGPREVSDEASRMACIACCSTAAKLLKLEPGEASEPKNPVSTSLPTETVSGITPAARYASISDLT